MNNKNYYFSNDSVNDRINKEKINISDIDLSLKIINMVCKDIAVNKTNIEVSELLIEELSELIKAVVKLERWDNGETTLRYSIDEISNNLYEELGDVIIMICQFIHKNKLSQQNLIDAISLKIISYYETISDKK